MAHGFDVSDGGRCASGVLICRDCQGWYPISSHVLDLLPESHARPGTRARFFAANRARLEDLGLRPPAESPPDPSFAAQMHQREHFDGLAERDDRFSYGAMGLQPFQRAVRSLNFEEWAPLIRAGTVVLDVGCANGLSTFDVARFDVEVIAFDISGEQIALAAARAEREGVRNVSFMVADASAIPVVDRGVDSVLCYGCLHHLPDPEGAVAEVARVMRDGGTYLGVENNTTPLRPIFDALMKLRPIWLEEAGAHAQIGPRELHRWSAGTGLRLSPRSIVFVPPHLCNLLGYRIARPLVRLTNWLFERIPVLRDWGGLISITGRLGLSDAQLCAEGRGDNGRHRPTGLRRSAERARGPCLARPVAAAVSLAVAYVWLTPTLAKLYPTPSVNVFRLWQVVIAPEPREDVRSILTLARPSARRDRPGRWLEPGSAAVPGSPDRGVAGNRLRGADLGGARSDPDRAPAVAALLRPAAALGPSRGGRGLHRPAADGDRGAPARAWIPASLRPLVERLKGAIWIPLGLAALATVLWLLPAVITDSTLARSGNLAAGHIPTQAEDYWAVVNGRTPLVDYIAIYANLLPVILAPLIGASDPRSRPTRSPCACSQRWGCSRSSGSSPR